MVTVLTETTATQVSALPDSELWLTPEELQVATGWSLQPEGLCRGAICVPVSETARAEMIRAERVNATRLWSHMGKVATTIDTGDVWFLGDGAEDCNTALTSLQAPDFTLPDFTGRMHSLSDFRRQRVLLLTWASW